MRASVLLVDDDKHALDLLAARMTKREFVVQMARSAEECMELIRRNEFDVVITDNQMPDMPGAELCHQLKIRYPDVPSIVLTGTANVEAATRAIQAGAYDFLIKPVMMDALEVSVNRAVEHHRMVCEVRRLRSSIDTTRIPTLAGRSEIMTALTVMIRTIAPSDANVLITGESGTGKELVARAIHTESSRSAQPFVAINCGAMPANLLESELFGHVRGAFTDARVSRSGLFVQAGTGTMFLDEIGEMPFEMQAKLLRVLQERSVRPVGGDGELPVHARVVAATNKDLDTEVLERRFREDLYHRLNVLRVELPALRDRVGDIIEIADVILRRIAARSGKPTCSLSKDAARRLVDYNWPGNVRELENMLERSVAMSTGGVIEESALHDKVRSYKPRMIGVKATSPDELISLDQLMVRYAREVLETVGGNKTHASRILGIDRRSLYRLLEPRTGER
ncbi:MAG: sigma-54 dependent transcriptional regulator [Kofleriaceae bacterium]